MIWRRNSSCSPFRTMTRVGEPECMGRAGRAGVAQPPHQDAKTVHWPPTRGRGPSARATLACSTAASATVSGFQLHPGLHNASPVTRGIASSPFSVEGRCSTLPRSSPRHQSGLRQGTHEWPIAGPERLEPAQSLGPHGPSAALPGTPPYRRRRHPGDCEPSRRRRCNHSGNTPATSDKARRAIAETTERARSSGVGVVPLGGGESVKDARRAAPPRQADADHASDNPARAGARRARF